MIELTDVEDAAERIGGSALTTPVIRDRLAAIGDRSRVLEVFLKCENEQRTGSFKFRGAFSAARALGQVERARGLLAYSSGNHAQAVAAAARLLGTTATLLMPTDAPEEKRAAAAALGADVVGYDRYGDDRERLANALAAERGMTLIPPFDSEAVMAGQGTAALELLSQVGSLGSLIVPVGGGGLIAGCATVAVEMSPGIRVIGVEPVEGDDVRRSLAEGHRIQIPVPTTIADGQQLATPGALPFEVIKERVDQVVVVTDAEIVRAMHWLFQRHKVVLEPSGASGLAALLFGKVPELGERVGVILSGGNIGHHRFATLMRSHLDLGSPLAFDAIEPPPPSTGVATSPFSVEGPV